MAGGESIYRWVYGHLAAAVAGWRAGRVDRGRRLWDALAVGRAAVGKGEGWKKISVTLIATGKEEIDDWILSYDRKRIAPSSKITI